MKNDDAHFMAIAISKAREGIQRGQTPFGAVIVRDGIVVACSHNAVWSQMDATAHAEITAIRKACAELQTIDLTGTMIYSTCEPCPMCFGACHWSKLQRIVYGACIADARAAGFGELMISNSDMKQLGRSTVELTPGVLREECAELFRDFLARPERRLY